MHIQSLEVLTHDLQGTRQFYQDILQLHVTGDNKQTITIQLPSSRLVFHQATINAQYHIAFTIPHNLVSEAYGWLKNKLELIPVDGNQMIADFRNWNATAFYFLDNNSNILEF